MNALTPSKFLIFSLIIIAMYLLFPTSEKPVVNATPGGDLIVSFGDSLTFGTGATKGMDYPSQFAQLSGYEVINLGVPGDTTAQALRRLDKVLALNPRIVLITLGGNDLKNGVSRDIAFRNLKQIITTIQTRGALVILGGLEIPLFDRGFADAYAALAEETGIILIPNILKGLLGKPELMSDSIHPNDEGYRILAERFYEASAPYL